MSRGTASSYDYRLYSPYTDAVEIQLIHRMIYVGVCATKVQWKQKGNNYDDCGPNTISIQYSEISQILSQHVIQHHLSNISISSSFSSFKTQLLNDTTVSDHKDLTGAMLNQLHIFVPLQKTLLMMRNWVSTLCLQLQETSSCRLWKQYKQ